MTTGKVELAKTISRKTGTTQKQASEFINSFVETVEEIIEIPASIAPVFKAGKGLKEKLNS